jgi:hypothetical protein
VEVWNKLKDRKFCDLLLGGEVCLELCSNSKILQRNSQSLKRNSAIAPGKSAAKLPRIS